jgi:hypothetical protein
VIMSERDELSVAGTIATATGRALHGDVIDTLGGVGGSMNLQGTDLYLVLQIAQAVTSAGAATVDFELVSDAQAAIAVDGTATIHARSGAIGKAALVAGFRPLVVKLGGEGAVYERYLGVITNPAVAALTAGKLSVFLALNAGKWAAYADGI